jgi:hypothetical protein
LGGIRLTAPEYQETCLSQDLLQNSVDVAADGDDDLFATSGSNCFSQILLQRN